MAAESAGKISTAKSRIHAADRFKGIIAMPTIYGNIENEHRKEFTE